MRRSGSILRGVMAVENAFSTVLKAQKSSGLSSGVMAGFAWLWTQASVLDVQTASRTAKTMRLSLERWLNTNVFMHKIC